RAAEARLAQVRAGGSAPEVAVAQAQLAQAEAQLAEARSGALQVRLRLEEAAAARAQLAQALANLRQAEQRLGESRITAPIDGVVAQRSVAVGQSVIGSAAGGTPVLTLAQMTPVRVKAFVDEADINRITPQAQISVTADALSGVGLRGRIVGMAPQPVVEQNVTRYPVTIEVEDPRRQLRLGMTVDAEFVLARRSGVLLVPREAVRGQESQAVFVVKNGTLVPRLVRTGLSDGRFVEIVTGLREGELVYLGPVRPQGREAPRPPGGTPFQPNIRIRR
ncbi:MAG TPA: efflux RND transporter periplasmic adaptor subunit, partial [bacterium]|nr:efflux RND transporter periplasmic adaptor subunit [bacterium]